MTTRHLIDGVMQHTKARNDCQLAKLLGLDRAKVWRLRNAENQEMFIGTLDQIQRKTGIPFDKLFGWYRMPGTAYLGRVTVD
jgi:transcriptional regulator with XRE-family HTH domain